MPLIILTGYPTSGKTHRANQLYNYFTTRISTLPASSSASSFRVHLISDHKLHVSRSVYNLDKHDSSERSNNSAEKNARATIYAAVKRVLSAKDVVILDGGNYIKGWRYQLYCEAKAVRTPHCVVYVGTPVDRARELNARRLEVAKAEEELPYDSACWENLVFRYEEPSVFARWDSPLFTVLWDDTTPPCESIWEVLIGSEGDKKIVRPHAATIARKPVAEDYLHELDQTTQQILTIILEWLKDHSDEGGGEIVVGDNLVVELPVNRIGLPALQRLRRQFMSLNRTNSVPVSMIGESFVRYLNDYFEES